VIARLLRSVRDERGVTLVEMSMVMLVLGSILAFTLGSMAAFQTSATGGIRRVENLNEGRILMQVITKDVRTAAKLDATTSPFPDGPAGVYSIDGVTRADDNELVFLANLNQSTPCPKLIRLHVDGVDKLLETVTEPNVGDTPPNCTYPATPTRTRLVGRYIANAADEPIFTYFKDDGTGALVPFTTAETPLSVSDSLLVKAIGIELAIRKETSLVVDHTTLVNRVRLPNVYYNPPPEE
jgi:prepilin-type N-terminal cleavage/methylation domain-containing protein